MPRVFGREPGTSSGLTPRVGTLVDRPNRFVMRVDLPDGSRVRAYCPNTSRLVELFEPGRKAWVVPNRDPSRKTDHTVTRLRDGGVWVGIVARRANTLFARYLSRERREHYAGWEGWCREVPLGASQIDFLGRGGDGRPHWVEVKSLSSASSRDGRRFAFYSGTPSRRGYRHLAELGRAVDAGHRASCVFVVQRPDVREIRPGRHTEPGWLESLRAARSRGVTVRGFRCRWDSGSEELRVKEALRARL